MYFVYLGIVFLFISIEVLSNIHRVIEFLLLGFNTNNDLIASSSLL